MKMKKQEQVLQELASLRALLTLRTEERTRHTESGSMEDIGKWQCRCDELRDQCRYLTAKLEVLEWLFCTYD